MPEPDEYRHIAAWGCMLGSMPYYIQDEQRRAAKAGAPVRAVYQDHGSKAWVTIDECAPATQARIQNLVRIMEERRHGLR